MDDHHHHDHAGHYHAAGEKGLRIALFITVGYMAVEAAGGIFFNSLALLADAGHMLSDAMALGLSWVAIQIGKRSPTVRHTFGFKRTEILAALLNGVALWVIVALIVYEAFLRLAQPQPVAGMGMLIVAGIGLTVNLAMARILFKSRALNLNLKSAFLHVLSDALGSVGAIGAALIILWTGRYWVDPLVSVLIGVLILYSSWGLIKESVHILMEGVPLGMDVTQIENAMLRQSGVCCVYDLHVWSITSNRTALSAHVVLSDPHRDRAAVLRGLEAILSESFDIKHTTIQIEDTHEMRPPTEGISCRPGTTCNLVD